MELEKFEQAKKVKVGHKILMKELKILNFHPKKIKIWLNFLMKKVLIVISLSLIFRRTKK
jgi:hypothetical protein